jgi:hypothetical protein
LPVLPEALAVDGGQGSARREPMAARTIATLTALGLVALIAPASADTAFDGYAFYDVYDVGYVPGSYEADWFYDYYQVSHEPVHNAYDYARYDYAEDAFVWEEDDVLDEGGRR